jgi:hypothetical protein
MDEIPTVVVTAMLSDLLVDPKPNKPPQGNHQLQAHGKPYTGRHTSGLSKTSRRHSQICASRVLAMDEIPTVVVTAMLSDLLVDPKLTARCNNQLQAHGKPYTGRHTSGLSKTSRRHSAQKQCDPGPGHG